MKNSTGRKVDSFRGIAFVLLTMVLIVGAGIACSESEDSTDDLLLGFLAGGGGIRGYFYATRDSDQAGFSAGANNIVFNIENSDTANVFDTASGTFKPTSNGVWQMTCRFSFGSAEDGRYCQAVLYNVTQSGTNDTWWPGAPNSMGGTGTNCSAEVTATVPVVAGNEYACRVVHDMSGSQTVQGEPAENAKAQFTGIQVQ